MNLSELNLKIFVYHFQVGNIFGIYGILQEIFRPTDLAVFAYALNGIGIGANTVIAVLVIYAASILTNEADTTSSIFGKMMGITRMEEKNKFELAYLLAQLKSRNLKIRNFLFDIDWNVLLVVST